MCKLNQENENVGWMTRGLQWELRHNVGRWLRAPFWRDHPGDYERLIEKVLGALRRSGYKFRSEAEATGDFELANRLLLMEEAEAERNAGLHIVPKPQ